MSRDCERHDEIEAGVCCERYQGTGSDVVVGTIATRVVDATPAVSRVVVAGGMVSGAVVLALLCRWLLV